VLTAAPEPDAAQDHAPAQLDLALHQPRDDLVVRNSCGRPAGSLAHARGVIEAVEASELRPLGPPPPYGASGPAVGPRPSASTRFVRAIVRRLHGRGRATLVRSRASLARRLLHGSLVLHRSARARPLDVAVSPRVEPYPRPLEAPGIVGSDHPHARNDALDEARASATDVRRCNTRLRSANQSARSTARRELPRRGMPRMRSRGVSSIQCSRR
jgi:hypothetical protein